MQTADLIKAHRKCYFALRFYFCSWWRTKRNCPTWESASMTTWSHPHSLPPFRILDLTMLANTVVMYQYQRELHVLISLIHLGWGHCDVNKDYSSHVRVYSLIVCCNISNQLTQQYYTQQKECLNPTLRYDQHIVINSKGFIEGLEDSCCRWSHLKRSGH